MTRAILFDLDGTLADTAPDLGHALNLQLQRHGRAPVAVADIRSRASHGARGLLEVGFGLRPGDAAFEAMRAEFLDLYEANLCRHTRLFADVDRVLAHIEARGWRWGIVTNKPARFTNPLIEALDLHRRAAVVVSGDTTARAKPHPDSLLYAMAQIGAAAGASTYVGDDERDAQAARAAGMTMLAARWGYLGNGSAPEAWGADAIIDAPGELIDWFQRQS